MSEPIAQRTLVKSPPELWAEISDVEALARHLGAFGEIRITRMVPETTVAWEGDTARGTVQLSAAGWGTKVTLTATATAPPASEAPPASGAPATPPAAPIAHGVETPSAPAPLDREPAAEDARWAGSAEQKVRDRYVGAMPAISASDVRERVRDELVPARVESRAIEASPAAPAPAPTPAPTPTPTPTSARIAQPAETDDGAARSEEAPAPRGFLARMKAWFAPPAAWDAKAAHDTPKTVEPKELAPVEPKTPAPVEPKVLAPAEPKASTPVEPKVLAPAEPKASAPVEPETTRAERATPDVPPFPGAPPAPQPLPEPLPAAATHAAEPPLAAPATYEAPARADGAAPPAASPVDEGEIVGILTGVLDELGSAHHRPFSRGD